MANAVLQGACLREADISGAQLDAAVLIDPTSARRTCVAPDFVMLGWTLPTSVMPGLGVPSWSARRCAVPICAAHICAWQNSTAQICPMPIGRGRGPDAGTA